MLKFGFLFSMTIVFAGLVACSAPTTTTSASQSVEAEPGDGEPGAETPPDSVDDPAPESRPVCECACQNSRNTFYESQSKCRAGDTGFTFSYLSAAACRAKEGEPCTGHYAPTCGSYVSAVGGYLRSCSYTNIGY